MSKKISNKSRILRELYFAKALSCADLSERLDKSLPFVAKLINELLEEETIVETGFAPSRGGRRPQMYSLKSETFYIVAVSMDQLFTRIALVDTTNSFLKGNSLKIPLPLENNPNSLYLLIENIIQYLDNAAIDKNKIIGIGIGMPGIVDVQKGINYTFLEPPKGISLTQYMTEQIGIPVFIENDSGLIALSELYFGEARNKRNAMVVNVNWGVGLGIIINGELYRGENGFAGEFSHIPLFTNNQLCECGKHGCLGTETSLLTMITKADEAIKAGRVSKLKYLDIDDPEKASDTIIQYALEGDQLAIEILSDIAYKLGRGIAILIHLFNPQMIILSGRGSKVGRIWKAPIHQAINEYCIPKLAQHTKIYISTIGAEAELIGAAALVMENYQYIDSSDLDITHIEEPLPVF